MLQELRKHTTGWIAKFVLFLLVLTFSFWGIESYFVAQGRSDMARVGDSSVTQQDFQNEMSNLRRQAQNPQSGLNPDDFQTPEFRRMVLDRLINRILLGQANQKLGISVPDSQVRQRIATMPVFQVDGKFDQTTYQAILRQQGLTATGFQEQIRQDLANQVLPQAVAGSVLVTPAEVDNYLELRDQTRDLHYVALPVPEIDPKSVTEADIKAYYQAHTDEFMKPETVTIHYLQVSAADMTVDVSPSEEDIQARYEQEKNRFVVPEQREVAHILVAVPPNASPDEQKKALARADEIEQALKDGADFAKLAGEKSDDLGSKRQGGSLGWIEPGMIGGAFDDAAFSLAEGAVSAPVLSTDGYHIIKVQAIKPGHAKPLAEVRDEIVHSLLGSARERKYNEIAGRLVDLTFQDPTSLAKAAEELNLEVKTAGPFPATGGDGIAANPQVVQAAFSTHVLANSMNSDPVKLGDNSMVVLRVFQHAAAAPKPLEQVTDAVRTALVADRADSEAEKRAEAMLASLGGETTLTSLASTNEALDVKEIKELKRFPPQLPPAVMDKAFKMAHPAAGAHSFAMVRTGEGAFTLLQLDAVHPGDTSNITDAERQSVAMQLRNLYGQTEVLGLLDGLRAATDVSINKDQLLSEPM